MQSKSKVSKMNFSQCHKTAIREIVNAIKMMNKKKGSKATDIYYILDQLHEKVNRPVIKQALRSAVTKGILISQRGYYKISNKKSAVRRGQNKSVSVGFPSDSDYFLPVRNFECNLVNRAKSTNTCMLKNSYKFKEVDGPQSCQCFSSDDEMSWSSGLDESCSCEGRSLKRHKVEKRRKLDKTHRKIRMSSNQSKNKKSPPKRSNRKTECKSNDQKNIHGKNDIKRKAATNQNLGNEKSSHQTKEILEFGESSKSNANEGNQSESDPNNSKTTGQGQVREDPNENKDKPQNNRDYMGMYAKNTLDEDNAFYY